MGHVKYAECTPLEFQQRLAQAPIAYLPLGTLEWHGAHLPLGSDGLQSEGFFCALAEHVGGLVLPMLFLGPDRRRVDANGELYGMELPSSLSPDLHYAEQQLPGNAYWLPEELFRTILENILHQLRRAGFRIVVGHGHGPSTNFFQANAAAWREQFDLVCLTCLDEHPLDRRLGIQVDHAAANETSLVMALRPELVQMSNLPADPEQFPLAVWGEDPRIYASPEVGKQAIATQVERMAKLLQDEMTALQI